MSAIDDRIQKASKELQDALNAGDAAGKRYIVRADIGQIEGEGKIRYGYAVRVQEYNMREVA